MEIDRRPAEALATDTSLKYMMHWERGWQVQVGLRQVPRSTVLGSLQGPENIVSFRTVRYDRYPCVVSGPGAGAAVTAAGMVADMLGARTAARRVTATRRRPPARVGVRGRAASGSSSKA